MRYAPLLLLALAGCNSEENVWDKLSASERAAARALSREQCLDETDSTYKEFKADSADLYDSSNWRRGDGWRHQLKSGSTEYEKNDLLVWKNDGSELYLLVTQKVGATTTQFMLRIPKSVNADMIGDLQLQGCVGQVKARGGGPLRVVRKEYTLLREKFEDSYTFNFSQLAWMGFAYNMTRKVTTLDSDGDPTGTPVTYTSTFSRLSDPDDLPNQTDLPTVRCDVVDPGADATYPDLHYKIPYELQTGAACTGAGWNLNP